MRLPILPTLLATALLSAGCGGGGGNPTPVTVTLASTAALSGSISSAGERYGNLFVGDPSQKGWRAFVSFDLSPIPAGGTILSATLTLVQTYVHYAPYDTLGTVLVDRVVYGGVLEAGAYARSFPTHQGFGTLSTDATLGAKSLLVTAQVQDDVAEIRGRSQFRLRFTLEQDTNVTPDTANFGDPSDASTSDHPTLVVTYLP